MEYSYIATATATAGRRWQVRVSNVKACERATIERLAGQTDVAMLHHASRGHGPFPEPAAGLPFAFRDLAAFGLRWGLLRREQGRGVFVAAYPDAVPAPATARKLVSDPMNLLAQASVLLEQER
jgi:hypothetical protein